jgi:hypothetical protein
VDFDAMKSKEISKYLNDKHMQSFHRCPILREHGNIAFIDHHILCGISLGARSLAVELRPSVRVQIAEPRLGLEAASPADMSSAPPPSPCCTSASKCASARTPPAWNTDPDLPHLMTLEIFAFDSYDKIAKINQTHGIL